MRTTRSMSRRLIVGVTSGATMLAITAVAQVASASSAPHALTGTTPKWLGQATAQGAVAKSSQVKFGLLLKMRNQPGAEAAIAALTTPGSASYGKWLTNAQFNATYAPAASDVAAVKSWLGSQGFQVTKTLPSGMYVEA